MTLSQFILCCENDKLVFNITYQNNIFHITKAIFREKLQINDNTGTYKLDYDIIYDALVIDWCVDIDGDINVTIVS